MRIIYIIICLKTFLTGELNISDFFNLIYLKGFFPKAWRDAVIIPILKAGNDPKDPNSYRPISLISCLSRLLEKIINKRLIWYLEKMKLLDVNQLGFRVGKSTIDSITALVSEIQQAFASNKYHITIFWTSKKLLILVGNNMF